MSAESEASSVVLTARFFDHKSAVLAVSELITAGTPQNAIHLSFEEELTTTTNRTSLWGRMGHLWSRQNTPPVATPQASLPGHGKGATVTVRANVDTGDARALLDQHGAYFV